MTTDTAASPSAPKIAKEGWALWYAAYRVELWLFLISFLVLAMFSGQRFWRQSAAPHFVYQAKAWLEGRSDIDAQVLPNLEDWACVREVNGVKQRCTAPLQPSDRWYSSFPFFPSLLMLPFVAINGYQFNDTSFGVILGALAIALFYSLLRQWREQQGLVAEQSDLIHLALLLGFGTLFFYCALRGEVWFLAEVLGVGLTLLYVRHATQARNPVLAGLFWSMAVLTRTPLFFTALFFVLEALAPEKEDRMAQLKAFFKDPKSKLGLLGRFALGAAPLGVAAMIYNQLRFGSITEFGHRFFFNNRVNIDIDTWGLFHPVYLPRNLEAAFGLLPTIINERLTYSPWGLSLFITLPILALMVAPSTQKGRALQALGAMAAVLVFSALLPPQGNAPVAARPLAPGPATTALAQSLSVRSALFWLVLLGALGWLGLLAWRWVRSPDAPRLLGPLLLTLLACALPGLFYQNTGYAQFGFRFSLDYTPYIMAVIALGQWRMSAGLPLALSVLSVTSNFWGALAFRGYTEMTR